MKKLVLNRDHLREMLTKEDFYVACVEFAYLRTSAMDALSFHKNAGKLCCGRDWSFYRGVVDAFVGKVRELIRENPVAIDKVKDYLGTKKGYRPDRLIIFYRWSSRPADVAKLTF